MSARKGTGDSRRKSFACARILLPVTVYAVRTRDDLLSVRFAYSPVWETQGAVRTLADKRARPYHEAWQSLVCERVARLDLAPLLAVQPAGGYVPDFLTPPPETPRPRLRDQLAAIRASPPVRVERELERCRETVTEEPCRKVLSALLADPARARDLLAERLQGAWTALVAPFWNRIRALLERDIEQRSHALARQGLRRVLDELHPRLRWTSRGLMCDDHGRGTVELDGRGLVLMPSAYLWPHLAAIVDEPWLPTIAYPAHGIASAGALRPRHPTRSRACSAAPAHSCSPGSNSPCRPSPSLPSSDSARPARRVTCSPYATPDSSSPSATAMKSDTAKPSLDPSSCVDAASREPATAARTTTHAGAM
jgi:hypothetical protein